MKLSNMLKETSERNEIQKSTKKQNDINTDQLLIIYMVH